MKKQILILLFVVKCFAQTSLLCVDGPREINTKLRWDWYKNRDESPSWNVFIRNSIYQNIQIEPASPFYNRNNLNVKHLAIHNPLGFRDYLQEDGWELINYGKGLKNLSNLDECPIIIFYNRYTAKLRIFWLVTQLYGGFKRADGTNKPAFINISLDKDLSKFNVLTHNSSPLKALNEMPDLDEMYSYANSAVNQVPQWFYADFQMAYDPCVCHNPKGGAFSLRLGAYESASLNFTLEALPPPVVGSGTSANTNAGNPSGMSIKQFGDKVKAGTSAFKSQSDAVNNMNEYVKKLFPVGSKKYEESKFLAGFNVVGKIAKAIPMIGEVASATIGVFDFVTGLFKDEPEPEQGAPANTPVVIMNNFKASGSINSVTDIATASIPVPGSVSTLDTTEYKILYNLPLGVFNLLEKPIIEEKRYEYTKFEDLIFWAGSDYRPSTICGIIDGNRICSGNWNEAKNYVYSNSPSTLNRKVEEYTIERRYYKLTNNIKFVLNPALGFDLSKSVINASIEIQDCNDLSITGTVLQPKNTNYKNTNMTNLSLIYMNGGHYTSKYYNIGCINQSQVYIDLPKIRRTHDISSTSNERNKYTLTTRIVGNSGLALYSNYCYTPRVYIKISAVFRKTLPDGTEIEVPWIGKFEAEKLPFITINAPLPPTAEDLPSEVFITEPLNITQNTVITAFNIIKISSNVTVAPGVTLTLQAPVIDTQDAILTGTVIQTTDMGVYANTILCNKPLAAQTPAQIETFCKGNAANQYKPANRRLADNENETMLLESPSNLTLKIAPNPMQHSATIYYDIPKYSNAVNIQIFDAMGSLTKSVINTQNEEAGNYQYTIPENELSPGLYIVKLTTDIGSKSVKLVVQ